jgi:hypothetical protein
MATSQLREHAAPLSPSVQAQPVDVAPHDLRDPRYQAFWMFEYFDVAVRDLGLLGGALVLGRLASVYDPPLRRRR